MADLFERAWPVAGAKAGVVVVHGLTEHSGRYDHVASALNAKGYAVYAQDLRGHGRSIGFPGHMGDDAVRVTDDVAEFCTRVRVAHDEVFVLGHDVGALVAMCAMTRIPSGTVRGLVLSGTALVPGPAVDDVAATGVMPAIALSRDPAVVKAYEDDPLVVKRVTNEMLTMTEHFAERARRAVPEIAVPVVLVHGTDDEVYSISGANYVWVQLVLVDKVMQGYPGLVHEVLNEPEKDQVLKDVTAWLDAHLG